MVIFVLENSYDAPQQPTNDPYLTDYEAYPDIDGTAMQRTSKTYQCSLSHLEQAIIAASKNGDIQKIEHTFGTLDFSGADNELCFNSYEIEPSIFPVVFEHLIKTIEKYL